MIKKGEFSAYILASWPFYIIKILALFLADSDVLTWFQNSKNWRLTCHAKNWRSPVFGCSESKLNYLAVFSF